MPPVWSSKEERLKFFCAEYVKDFDAQRAARAVGVPEKSAKVTAWHWLRDPLVRREMSRLYAGREQEAEATVARVLSELSRVAFANIEDYIIVDAEGDARVDLSGLTREQAAAIASIDRFVTTEHREDGDVTHVTVKFKLHDKLRALELLGKHLKMFRDLVEIPGVERLADELRAARQRAAIDVEVVAPGKGLTQ